MKMSGLLTLSKAMIKVQSISSVIPTMTLIMLSLLCLVPHPSAEAQMQFWPAQINYQVAPGVVFPAGYTGDIGLISFINKADFNEDGHGDLIFLKYISGATTDTAIDVLLWDDAIGGFKTPAVSTGKARPGDFALLAGYGLGNFNSDTHIDAAMIEKIDGIGGVISLYTGNGDGSFTAPDLATYYQIENVVPADFLDDAYYLSCSVADFNLDGHPDLAISVGWDDNTGPVKIKHGYISVLLGNGDGTFGTPVHTVDLGVGPAFKTVADFNGDGVPDLAFTYGWETIITDESGTIIGSPNHESVRILLGNGDGTFTSHSQIDNMGMWSILAADFNGDGKMDLASVFGDSDIKPVGGGPSFGYAFSMSLGNGDGTFSNPGRVYETGADPKYLSAADFNMDGFSDIAVANSGDKTISIFLWDNINGDFITPPIILTKGHYEPFFSPVWFADPYEIVASDFNNDGRVDLAATSYDYGVISTFFGDGTGHFVETPTSDTDNWEFGDTLIVADLNGDGLGDMASIAWDYSYDDTTDTYTINRSYINMYWGDGAGGFAPPVQHTVGNYPSRLMAEDFNKDGALDLAILNSLGDSVTILLGSGLGLFSEATGSPFAVGHFPSGIQSGDFNNDGNLDLATVNIEAMVIFNEPSPVFPVAQNGSISILLGDGTGTFAAAPGSPAIAGIAPESVTTSDFNNDGNDDLAITNLSECSFSVYLSNGNGTFTLAGTFDALCPEPLFPLDLEFLELLFSSFVTGRSLKIFSGDIDGDGLSDIVTTNSTGQSFKVFRGDGTGNFDPTPIESPIGYGMKEQGLTMFGFGDWSLPPHFDAADLNGDGVKELLATNGVAEMVFTAFLDQNDEIFTNGLGYGVGGIPVWFTLGDIEGDGNTDVITMNLNFGGDSFVAEKNISILFNNSPAVPTTLSATATSCSSIRLDWTDSSDDETGFVVERSTDGGVSWTEITSAIPAGTTSWTDNGLAENTSCLYRMRSQKVNLRSQPTDEAGATTLCCPPDDPVSLTLTVDSCNQITLNWDGTAVTNELGFIIEHSDTGLSGSWMEIATVGTDVHDYQHQGLTGNTPNYYRLRAYRDCGAGINVYSNYTQEAEAGVVDTDSDGTPDCSDTFPDDPGEWSDNDGDGTGDNADIDDDNDGMPDDWEEQYGLNPLVDDAQDDIDGDGVSNIDEYNAGWDPTQLQVNQPVLFLPVDGEVYVSLTPELETEAFSDPDPEDIHFETRWQISTESDFSDALKTVLDVTCGVHLTTLTVPASMLNVDTTYYWRVKFFDDRNGESDWSLPFSFTTISAADSQDTDQNGIPDDQENDTVDLDGDGNPDIGQADIKSVDTVVGNAQVGVKMSTNVTSIDEIRSIDPDDIPDTNGRPKNLRFGLISFKIHVASPGDVANVTIYLSERADRKEKWFKYDPINGWQDYSDHAVFSSDRKSVVLELKDGGFGDADGTANGVIVDPSGVGTPIPATVSDGGGGCFINTVAKDLFGLLN